jgi:predicted nucleic acid-binding protein
LIAYFETSALVKLLIAEPETPVVEVLWDETAGLVTSRLTYHECRAALAVAARTGRLTRSALRAAKAELERRWRQFVRIEVAESVARAAGDLAEHHALRAYDAVHLASALEAGRGGSLLFVSFDRTLLGAARRSGLAVAPTV